MNPLIISQAYTKCITLNALHRSENVVESLPKSLLIGVMVGTPESGSVDLIV